MKPILLASLLLGCLLAACADDAAQFPELRAKWTSTTPGPVVIEDNATMLVYDARGLIRVDLADGQVLSREGERKLAMPQDPNQLKWGSSLLVRGPQGRYLVRSEREYLLVSEDSPQSWIKLEAPLPTPGLAFPMTNAETQMCFIGGKPLVLHWGQLAMAYGTDGSVVWSHMSGPFSRLMPSADGQRVCINASSGLTSCLSAEGELLWQFDSVNQMRSAGDRLLLLDYREHTLSALDWDGRELWSREGIDIQPNLQLGCNGKAGRILLCNGNTLECFDLEGKLLWNREIAWEKFYRPMISDDGHCFIDTHRKQGRVASLFGGRFGVAQQEAAVWICLDPQGQPLWQSRDAPFYSASAIPGPQGMLLLEEFNSRKFSCFAPQH